MEDKIQFSVDNIYKYTQDEDPELAIAEVAILSTRPNSHGLIIKEDVLRECAPTILSKFLVGEMGYMQDDTKGHTDKQVIFGYFPKEQEVKFVKEDGFLVAKANAIVSKLYSEKFYNIFTRDNGRKVSIEMTVKVNKETNEIMAFNATGVTVLGKSIAPSCPDAQMSIIQFSEEKAEEFYKTKFSSINVLKEFSEKRKKSLSQKSYKVNKTELKTTPWGEVDKVEMRNKIMDASNKSSLVKDVYAKVESGWQDAPSEHLKYPIMQLIGDTFYYNRHALSSALGYAEKEGETGVVEKVNKIYKKFDLDKEEGEVEMSKEKLEEIKEDDKAKAEEEKEKVDCKMEDDVDDEDDEPEHDDNHKEDESEKMEEIHQVTTPVGETFECKFDLALFEDSIKDESDEDKAKFTAMVEKKDLNIIMDCLVKTSKDCLMANAKLAEISAKEEQENKNAKLSECFENLKFTISEDKKMEFIKQSEAVSFENINTLINEIKVFAMENGTFISSNETGHISFGEDMIVHNPVKETGDVITRNLKRN